MGVRVGVIVSFQSLFKKMILLWRDLSLLMFRIACLLLYIPNTYMLVFRNDIYSYLD